MSTQSCPSNVSARTEHHQNPTQDYPSSTSTRIKTATVTERSRQKMEKKQTITRLASPGFVGDIIIEDDPDAALSRARQEYENETSIHDEGRKVWSMA